MLNLGYLAAGSQGQRTEEYDGNKRPGSQQDRDHARYSSISRAICPVRVNRNFLGQAFSCWLSEITRSGEAGGERAWLNLSLNNEAAPCHMYRTRTRLSYYGSLRLL
jgi:hypothetical protein